jgi:cell wall-associated NlpC family hydrolase
VAIKRYQLSYGFPRDASEYVHAALYIANTEIIHAVPNAKIGTSSGVQSDNLGVYGIGSTICLLRCHGMTPALSAIIVANAKARRGNAYDYAGIFADAVWTALKEKMGLMPAQTKQWKQFRTDATHYRRMHCSGLVRRVYLDVLGVHLNPLIAGQTPAPLYTPADIYSARGMDTVIVA